MRGWMVDQQGGHLWYGKCIVLLWEAGSCAPPLGVSHRSNGSLVVPLQSGSAYPPMAPWQDQTETALTRNWSELTAHNLFFRSQQYSWSGSHEPSMSLPTVCSDGRLGGFVPTASPVGAAGIWSIWWDHTILPDLSGFGFANQQARVAQTGIATHRTKGCLCCWGVLSVLVVTVGLFSWLADIR